MPDWRERVDYLSWHLGNEVGRRWWDRAKDGWPENIVRNVDSILEKRSPSENQDLLDAILPTDKNGGYGPKTGAWLRTVPAQPN